MGSGGVRRRDDPTRRDPMMGPLRWLLVAATVLSMTAVACSEDGGDEAADAQGSVSVTDVWGWSSTPDRGAVYFTVENTGAEADRLMGASSDAAGVVQVHETTMVEGTAQMSEVDGVDIPAGGTVTFEPGGYHVMMMEIPEPLEVGSTIDVTVTFEGAGDIDVTAEIRAFTGEAMEGDGEM
jgi:copper(I)-binding protein